MSEKELFVCIGEDNELYSINWDENTDKRNKTFSLSGTSYNDLIDDEKGEEQARELLEDSSYWEELGYLGSPKQHNNPVFDFIDFVALANHIINTDGWQMTGGEYYIFGQHKGKDYYLNYSSCGQIDDSIRNAKVKKWLIPQKEVEELLDLWKNYHLINSYLSGKKADGNNLSLIRKKTRLIFEKNSKMQAKQSVLNAYIKATEASK